MAKRRDEAEPVVVESVETPPAKLVQPGPIPGTVRIWNLRPEPWEITLCDATHIRLAPFSKAGERHISKPIPKKNLPDAVAQMVKRREVKLVEEVA